MRIGICGAESTGKSTLARALSTRLGLELISEQARYVAKELGITDLNEGYPRELLEEFQWRCLEAQIGVESRHEDFISDRTVIDNLSYWLVDHGTARYTDTINYWERVRNYLSRRPYDLIIYARPDGVPFEVDGFRHNDPDHRGAIDCMLQALLAWAQQVSPSIYVMKVHGCTPKRIEQVSEVVEYLMDSSKLTATV
ncbi:MAG TPA: ATP-binding protein [Firmicutes bacterium]|nr:ATP-binding protein [Bacillota bacterium]